jgi:hypothetical protein
MDTTANFAPDFALEYLNFLVKTFLFFEEAPFPLTREAKKKYVPNEQLAKWSFNSFGCNASFGTLENTLEDLRKDKFQLD